MDAIRRHVRTGEREDRLRGRSEPREALVPHGERSVRRRHVRGRKRSASERACQTSEHEQRHHPPGDALNAHPPVLDAGLVTQIHSGALLEMRRSARRRPSERIGHLRRIPRRDTARNASRPPYGTVPAYVDGDRTGAFISTLQTVRERTDCCTRRWHHRRAVNEEHASCDCGHQRALHDPYGCAAFLGSFAPTADIKRYCSCKRPGAALLSVVQVLLAQPPVVAEVRVRECRGAAIGVCEFPPALELGGCADEVLQAMKARLRMLISPPGDGSRQALRVVHERDRSASIRVEALR
jgi:hypothetical protein